MALDALEAARWRYTTAYAVYARASKHVAKMFAAGLNPSAEELGDEANATEELATARRELLNATSHLVCRSGSSALAYGNIQPSR